VYLRLIDHGPPGALYVGGCPKDERDLDTLRGASITTVITLCKRHPGEEVVRTYAATSSWYYHPVQDGRTLQTADYLQVASWAAKLQGDGQRVLVHCLAGRNRSCLVAALVLRQRYGYTGAAAAELVRRARDRAFHNELQLEWLRSLPAPQ
jgi:protein-tyrosine phosphatase